jgi:sporulation protein YlmC with PRC-barrel domain
MALHSISGSNNVRFQDGTYDLRSFAARSRSGVRVGAVDDVIVDDEGNARYICVQRSANDRHMLVPVGIVDAEPESKEVSIPDGEYSDIPEYSHQAGTIDTDYERRIVSAWETDHTGEQFYDRSDYRSRDWSGSQHKAQPRLERLDRLRDYRVAHGDPDPRGWLIVGRNGKTLGKVDHLIGDTESMRIVYLDVELDRDLVHGKRHILVPTGHVEIDSERKRVIARGIDTRCALNLPEWTGGAISRDYEREIVGVCDTAYEGANRYEHPRYRDEHIWQANHDAVRGISGDREMPIPATENEFPIERSPQGLDELIVRRRDVGRSDVIEDDARRRDTDDRTRR